MAWVPNDFLRDGNLVKLELGLEVVKDIISILLQINLDKELITPNKNEIVTFPVLR